MRTTKRPVFRMLFVFSSKKELILQSEIKSVKRWNCGPTWYVDRVQEFPRRFPLYTRPTIFANQPMVGESVSWVNVPNDSNAGKWKHSNRFMYCIASWWLKCSMAFKSNILRTKGITSSLTVGNLISPANHHRELVLFIKDKSINHQLFQSLTVTLNTHTHI